MKTKILVRLALALMLLLGALPLSEGYGQPRMEPIGQTPAWWSGLVSADFGLFAPGQGWFLLSDQLFLTGDSGNSWRDITPDLVPGSHLQAVTLNPDGTGWAFSSAGSLQSGRLWRTEDGGEIWKEAGQQPVLGIQSEGDMPLAEVQMDWLDGDHGWLLLKQGTGVNFSQGWLFGTKDGGASWDRLEAPAAEEMIFLDERLGFMRQPFRDGALFMTTNAGASWLELDGTMLGLELSARLLLPMPADNGQAWLPVITQEKQAVSEVSWYLLQGDGSWARIGVEQLATGMAGTAVWPVQMTSSGPETWALPEADVFSMLSTVNGALAVGTDVALGSFSSSGPSHAWAKFQYGQCDTLGSTEKQGKDCVQQAVILETRDGGLTWAPLTLPIVEGLVDLAETQSEIGISGEQTLDAQGMPGTEAVNYWVKKVVGQGFDACDIPTLSQLETWFFNSPYEYVNMYIGGIARACANTDLTANYVSQMYIRGWRFIPTWVGPQAPCTTFKRKFSSDPAEAYQQGVDNANQAKAVLQTLGMTNPDGSGSLVYYDLEYFSGDAVCKAAVRSFLDGWTTRLHELNIYSGLYGSSCNINNYQLYTIAPPPDFVWLASWSSTYYDPNQTVWNVGCLPASYWDFHQRLHQYAGGHDETWGGVTINIDSNVLDGAIAGPLHADFTDPVSNASISGTIGILPWYKTPVTVSLTATDNSVGVKASYYKVDQGAWQLYTAPFQVAGSAQKTVSYLSVDNVNNWEDTKTITFYVDSEPPINPRVQSPGCMAYNGLPQGNCSDPDFSWTGASDAGVGLAENDTYQVYWGTSATATTGTLTNATRLNPPAVAPRVPMYLRIRTQDKHGIWSAWTTLYTFIYDPNITSYLLLPMIIR